jgi:hypothetical protein
MRYHKIPDEAALLYALESNKQCGEHRQQTVGARIEEYPIKLLSDILTEVENEC